MQQASRMMIGRTSVEAMGPAGHGRAGKRPASPRPGAWATSRTVTFKARRATRRTRAGRTSGPGGNSVWHGRQHQRHADGFSVPGYNGKQAALRRAQQPAAPRPPVRSKTCALVGASDGRNPQRGHRRRSALNIRLDAAGVSASERVACAADNHAARERVDSRACGAILRRERAGCGRRAGPRPTSHVPSLKLSPRWWTPSTKTGLP
jgi:hypothetical protein